MRLLLSICLAILACGWCDGLRILALFPITGKSHWIMEERLMIKLAERGHHVDIYTHFPMKNPPKNYNQYSLAGSLEIAVNSITADNVTHFGNVNLEKMSYIAGDRLCDLMKHPHIQKLIKNPPKEPYDLIATELFMSPCYLAFGTYLKVPVIGMITSSFIDWFSHRAGNPINLAITPGLLTSFTERMTFWERLQNTFITNMIMLQTDYYVNKQNSYVKRYMDLDVEIPELYKNLALILVNSHHSVTGVTTKHTGIIEVGGLHLKEDGDPLTPEMQKWLDESTHGCVYFTFGSMVRIETFPKSLVETFYKVFKRIAPVRVMMKVAKKEDLLPGLPNNVMIQPWFPQVSVLKHKNLKAFITHGGLMGTQEAIYFGIPLIGIPLFGDQNLNLQNVARKNVAVNLGSFKNVTEENLYNAIKSVLYDEKYKSNMQKLSELFKDIPMTALDTAVYWVEYVARHGYILQSSAIHLNVFQQNLLDVYGFMLLCVVTVLYLVILLIRKAKNFVFGHKSCLFKKNQSKEEESKKTN